jgi:hypothetical protein
MLKKLRLQVEAEGLVPDSPAFEHRLLDVKMEACRGQKRVAMCSECAAFWDCSLVAEYMARSNKSIDKK